MARSPPELAWGASAIHWQFEYSSLDKPFGVLVIKPSWGAIRGGLHSETNRPSYGWMGLGLLGLRLVGHSGGLDYSRSGFRWQSS